METPGVWRRRRLVLYAVLGALGLLAVLVWFQPQKLFVDTEVNEALPGTSAQENVTEEDPTAPDDPSPSQPAASIRTVAGGKFRPLAHPARGEAKVIESPNGATYLRLEDFEVENGPDLRVYLSAAAGDTADDELGSADFADLGALKGNVGNQNYRIPGRVDVGDFASALIWCRRFSVGFAVAPLV